MHAIIAADGRTRHTAGYRTGQPTDFLGALDIDRTCTDDDTGHAAGDVADGIDGIGVRADIGGTGSHHQRHCQNDATLQFLHYHPFRLYEIQCWIKMFRRTEYRS